MHLNNIKIIVNTFIFNEPLVNIVILFYNKVIFFERKSKKTAKSFQMNTI